MQFSPLLLITALVAGAVAFPATEPTNSTLLDGELITDDDANNARVYCANPGHTSRVKRDAIKGWIDLVKRDDRKWCAINPHGIRDSDHGWVLVTGQCGQDEASIWLQTWEKNNKFCMTGKHAATIAEKIVNGCNGDEIYGYVRVGNIEQWVEIGSSTSGCQPRSGG